MEWYEKAKLATEDRAAAIPASFGATIGAADVVKDLEPCFLLRWSQQQQSFKLINPNWSGIGRLGTNESTLRGEVGQSQISNFG